MNWTIFILLLYVFVAGVSCGIEIVINLMKDEVNNK